MSTTEASTYEDGRLALLRAAESAVVAGDDNEALRRLLDAWRALADARLPAIIERLRVPSRGTTGAMSSKDWFELETKHDPRDLPVLLGTLVGRRLNEAVARLKKLGTWHRDPLISAACTEWLLHPPLTAYTTQKFYEEVIAVLERQRDPHANARLRGYECSIQHRLGVWMTKAVVDFVEHSREPAKKMSPAEHEVLDRIEAVLTKRDTPKTSLLHKVFESPSDDSARVVYSDWLLERGDPRGTFIALQLLPSRRGKEERTMDRLLKEYSFEWLGPLGPVLTDVAFARGFPCRATICGAVGSVVEAPEWATFERLVAMSTHGDGQGLVKVLLHPRMKVLRSIAIPTETANVLFAERSDWSDWDIELYGAIDAAGRTELASSSLRMKKLYVRVNNAEATASIQCIAERLDIKGLGWKITIERPHGTLRVDASYDLDRFLPELRKGLLHLAHRPAQLSIKEPNVLKPLTKEIRERWPDVAMVTAPLDDSF